VDTNENEFIDPSVKEIVDLAKAPVLVCDRFAVKHCALVDYDGLLWTAIHRSFLWRYCVKYARSRYRDLRIATSGLAYPQPCSKLSKELARSSPSQPFFSGDRYPKLFIQSGIIGDSGLYILEEIAANSHTVRVDCD